MATSFSVIPPAEWVTQLTSTCAPAHHQVGVMVGRLSGLADPVGVRQSSGEVRELVPFSQGSVADFPTVQARHVRDIQLGGLSVPPWVELYFRRVCGGMFQTVERSQRH